MIASLALWGYFYLDAICWLGIGFWLLCLSIDPWLCWEVTIKNGNCVDENVTYPSSIIYYVLSMDWFFVFLDFEVLAG